MSTMKQSKRYVSKETFYKWQQMYKKEHQSMAYLYCNINELTSCNVVELTWNYEGGVKGIAKLS